MRSIREATLLAAKRNAAGEARSFWRAEISFLAEAPGRVAFNCTLLAEMRIQAPSPKSQGNLRVDVANDATRGARNRVAANERPKRQVKQAGKWTQANWSSSAMRRNICDRALIRDG